MKRIAILCVAAVSLASCTTTSIDAGIRQSLPQICAGAETAFAILGPFIDAGKVKAKTAAAATAAHEHLQIYCSNRDGATLASTLVAASAAALTISTAVREAKRTE